METVIGFLFSLLLVIFGAGLLGWLLHAWWRGRLDCVGALPGLRNDSAPDAPDLAAAHDGEAVPGEAARLRRERDTARDEAETLRLKLWNLTSATPTETADDSEAGAPAALMDADGADDGASARIAELESALALARSTPVVLSAPAPVMTTEYVPRAPARAEAEALESALETAQARIASLEAHAEESGADRIAALEQALAAAGGGAAAATLMAGDATAAPDNSDLEASLAEARQETATLEGSLLAVREEAQEAQAEASAARDRITALEIALNNAKGEMSTRVEELEATLATERAEARKARDEAGSALEQATARENERITALEQALDSARRTPVVLGAPAPVMTTEYVPTRPAAAAQAEDAASGSEDESALKARLAKLEIDLAAARSAPVMLAAPAPVITTEFVPVMESNTSAAPAPSPADDDETARLREEARRLRLRLWEVTSGREGATTATTQEAGGTQAMTIPSDDGDAGKEQAPADRTSGAGTSRFGLLDDLSTVEAEARRLLEAGGETGGDYRPAGLLSAPDAGGADDLKRIEGINAAYETGLNDIGVYHYRQLARINGRDLAWLDTRLGADGASISGRWPSQATELDRLKRLAQPLPTVPGGAETLDIPTELSSAEREALLLIESDSIDDTVIPAFVLSAPEGNAADDLKEIRGIAYKLEAVLNTNGVYHFRQIAGMTAQDIAWLDKRLKFRGRIIRDRWVAQAAMLDRAKNSGE